MAAIALAIVMALGGANWFTPAVSAADAPAKLGVASCAGSTCHGRMEADGKIVRQDELMRWQEPSTPGGAHSRAYAVLSTARSAKIAARLGIGNATSAPACLGCHADPAASRGPRYQLNDGVGCEACHGNSAGWIASHYAVGASHAANVARGMVPLENAKARASVCLDCHYGSSENGQFVSHRIMSAGHPRISFELDLFSTLQQHHNEDGDYAARKGRTDNVRLWVVGQAMALQRSLALFSNPQRGTEGIFPEFYFYDCHSCHRRIFDTAEPVKTSVDNPGRPIPDGMPPYNDENIIMLSAAARVLSPGLASQFEANSRAFHSAMARDRGAAIAAGKKLSQSAGALADAASSMSFGTPQTFAMIRTISGGVMSPRFTDYAGSVQAVMAIDTLLNALVNSGAVTIGAAAGIRADINRAYNAVREPNDFRPVEFRASLGAATRSIGAIG
jgi:hypothetical protein